MGNCSDCSFLYLTYILLSNIVPLCATAFLSTFQPHVGTKLIRQPSLENKNQKGRRNPA